MINRIKVNRITISNTLIDYIFNKITILINMKCPLMFGNVRGPWQISWRKFVNSQNKIEHSWKLNKTHFLYMTF